MQEEVDVSGQAALTHYHERIKPLLTEDDVNRFIAIDPDSGEWEISDDRDAVDKLRKRVPGAYPFLLVHPRIWVESFGGYGFSGCDE